MKTNFKLIKSIINIIWFIFINLILGICSNCYAKYITNINSLRIWPSPGSIRIVFDLNSKPKYKIYNLAHGNSITIEFINAKLNSKLASDLSNITEKVEITSKKNNAINSIKKIDTLFYRDNVKIILELTEPIISNSFVLQPNEHYGHRLVLDLEANEKQKILALFDLDKSNEILPHYAITQNKKLIIAIDPGHGGEDPGAIGPKGTLEKDIVLSIAKILKNEINKSKNMRAFLVRNGDYYVGLKDRTLIARRNKADLFISIHADAFPNNTKADGASVFVLSEHGESSAAAKWLAESQNNSDIIGGVRISNKNDVLASVIFDLSQTVTSAGSFNAAKSIFLSIKKNLPLHKTYIERANFAVLKAPDVPSVLIEAGFISNPKTELKLKEKHYQKQIAKSIIDGIYNYFASQPKKV